jgi:DNA-binding CsgD family transcriptional regulator
MPQPLIGRERELSAIRSLLEGGESGRGGAMIFRGESGVGKSRLLHAGTGEAKRRGWSVAVGRAYPVESGIPYAPFADAFVPLLRSLPPETLATVTRGAEAELPHLFPMLRSEAGDRTARSESAAELKSRLLWNFAEVVARLASRNPLLIVLDDLQWADASSLELMHFVVRQIAGERVAFLGGFNESAREESPQLRPILHALTTINAAQMLRVEPLTHAETGALIRQVFGVSDAASGEFATLLFGWTRGNPFFLDETLKALVESGRIHREEGVWRGWELAEIALPHTVREAVLSRLQGLSESARELAELLAVIGTSIPHRALLHVAEHPEPVLVAAIDELRGYRILEERLEGDAVVYDFGHPAVRETLYSELGLARAKLLHGRVAVSLEAYFGPAAADHAGELAYHYSRTDVRELAGKAVLYLAAAGRAALVKYSNREAAAYLSAAVERSSRAGDLEDRELIEDLARARQRLGEYDAAAELWRAVLDEAEKEGDVRRAARAYRRLGLVRYWTGQFTEALELLDAGLAAAGEAGDEPLQARLRLARAECQMELGRPAEAREEIEAALAIAEARGEAGLLARVHLALLLLHTWTGPPERARFHGAEALSRAEELGDPGLSCVVRWGLTVLSGLTGDVASARRHLAACEQLADEIRSPLHRIRVAEPAVELFSNTGDWESALGLAERTISTARALNQRAVLARLLVWTALVHLGRGDVARGRRYVEEAWELAGAGVSDRPVDVHTVVPAHVGRTAYNIATGDFAEAVRVGEAGLAIADRTGYTVWAIHRLLPLVAEAYVSMGDIEGAARIGARLRADSERLGHQLGLAWADACDAVILWLRGDIAGGILGMRAAAERLESIPVVPDAARLRRHFAARLRDFDQREEALAELRRIHEIFVRLGAERELAKTREQIRELGARPPIREAVQGVDGMSAREIEIATLAAEGKSNKTIAKVLDISPRTVGTHLSNIYTKLEIGSRAELSEALRRMNLPQS